MEPISVAIGTFIVFGLGVVAGWFAVRERGPAMYARAKAEAAGDFQALTERLASRDLQLSELRSAFESRDRDNARFQHELKTETERRITAEGRSARTGALEAEVHEREQQLASVQSEASHLRSQAVEAQAKGDEARRMLEARNTLFEELRSKHSDREAQVVQAHEDLGNFRAATAELAAKFDQRHSLLEERQAALVQARAELAARDNRLSELFDQVADLKAQNADLAARIDETKRSSDERVNAYGEAQQRLSDSFKALCAEALQHNNQSFLQLAGAALSHFQDGARGDLDQRQNAINESLKPLRESLEKVDSRIVDLERERTGAYAGLSQQVESLARTQAQLSTETANLVNALRRPSVRGNWGEMQLRRVVELAGMVEYCDFVEQQTFEGESGRLRPDLTIKLPNERQIVVDAKTPLSAYLEALDAKDETERTGKLRLHARQVRDHLLKLGNKSYWEPLGATPEFVVAFLPGETFFQAALEQDSSLIEFGVEQKVLLATPTTLIALLKAVAYGWRQDKMSASAKEIRDLGKSLYDRLRVMAEHFEETRKHLERTNASFNRSVGTFENRVLVSARKFKELGASPDAEIPVLAPVDALPRAVQAFDMNPEPIAEAEPLVSKVVEPLVQAVTEPVTRAAHVVEALAEIAAGPEQAAAAAESPEPGSPPAEAIDWPFVSGAPNPEPESPAPLVALQSAVAHEPPVVIEPLEAFDLVEPEYVEAAISEPAIQAESEFVDSVFVEQEFVESEYVEAEFVSESAGIVQAAEIVEEAHVVEEAQVVEQAHVVEPRRKVSGKTNLIELAIELTASRNRSSRKKAEPVAQ